MIKKLIPHLVNYFMAKSIIYSTCYDPGIYLKASEIKGKKYITIAITNRPASHDINAAYVYHVPVEKVTGIQKVITPFLKWWYTSVRHLPLPVYAIKKLSK